MAYNWLIMTSSGDDNWSSGSLGLLTDKTKKKIINKPKAEQETAQPSAARFNNNYSTCACWIRDDYGQLGATCLIGYPSSHLILPKLSCRLGNVG